MTGIVVVTWNSEEVIGACLDACLRLPDVQVVVVDNASADGTVDEVRRRPQVRLIANGTNRGFAGGVNQGVELLSCPVVLILNPDAVPVANFDILAQAARAAGVGAAGGALLGADGVPQHGFNVRRFPAASTLAYEVLGLNRLFPWNPVNRRYRVACRSEGLQEVDQPAGAFLMVNRTAWAAIGGFDESFHPVWFEDVDFCLRLKKAGYRIIFVPEATARHIGGHSASRVRWDQRQVFWYGNLLRYASTHFAMGGRRLVAAAVMLGFLIRSGTAILFRGRLSAVSVYSEVFRRARRCWSKGQCLSDLQAGQLSRKERKATLY